MANIERLQKMRDHFAQVPREEIEMNKWWCGTEGCLLGHACQIPEFRKAGLKLDRHPSFVDDTLFPWYGGTAGSTAGAVFFDITHEEARHLFSGMVRTGNVKERVLFKLDDLIARHTPTPVEAPVAHTPVVVEEVTPQEEVQRTPLAN